MFSRMSFYKMFSGLLFLSLALIIIASAMSGRSLGDIGAFSFMFVTAIFGWFAIIRNFKRIRG